MDEINIKEYCVYTHRDMNGKIFYVGMGNRKRPFDVSKPHRTKKWNAHVEQYGLGSIDIIAWYDTKEEALACEGEFTLLLKDFGEPLTNVLIGRKYARPDDSPMFGKEHSEEAKKKMSESKIGEKNHMFGKIGEAHPQFGKLGYASQNFNGIWLGIRNRDSAVIAFAGSADINNRGFNPGSISASARCIYQGNKNNYKKFTWAQTLDADYLQSILEQNNFVDGASKVVITEFLDWCSHDVEEG